MMGTRRWGRASVLLLLVTLVGGIATASLAQQSPSKGPTPRLVRFVDELPVPATIDLTGGGAATLTQVSGTHRFHRDLPPTPTFGYDASYLGPTLEVQRVNP
jgi:hypothetical protein